MDAKVQKSNEFAKLSWLERVGYGAGDFAQNLVFGTTGGFLLFYLTTVNGLASVVGANIFLFVRLVNVVWDPLVGVFVDKHSFKNGQYKPYLVYAGVPLVIFATMLFLPFEALQGSVPYAFLSYLATALTYSFVNIPYGSLNASMTRDSEQIAILTSTRMTLANVGNLLVYTMFPMFVQMLAPNRTLTDTGFFGLKLSLGNYASPDANMAWFQVYGVYMVIGFAALMLTYFTVKERVVADKKQAEVVKVTDLFGELKRNKPLRILGLFFLVGFTLMFFGNTAWPFFLQYNVGHSEWAGAVGLIGSIPGIFMVALWPKLRRVFGKKGFFYFSLSLLAAGSFLFWIWSLPGNNDNIALAYVSRFIQQWGLTSATGFMWALVPEVVSYGEAQSGKRVTGIINAIMGLFFKIGLALGGILPGYINAITGFKAGAETQSETALNGILISLVWMPIGLAAVAMFIMSRYPLSDQDVREINEQIVANK